mgnify:CR=1 FL=1
MNYQGLFYLASGFSAFLLLFVILRTIGLNLRLKENVSSQFGFEDNAKWDGIESLEIVDIISESSDVKTFQLKRISNKDFPSFSAGQFLSFKIDSKNFRSYSISSSSINNHFITVAVKLIKDGVGSSYFHSLEVGDSVQAYAPSGLFTDEALPSNSSRIYIGGGIGITPLISMIRSALDKGDKSDLVLFYGARSFEDLVFHESLVLLSKRNKNFSYIPVLSEQSEGWSGEKGFISIELIQSKVSSITDSNFYFCGPSVMTDSISEKLLEEGISNKKIHSEKFISPTSVSADEIEQVSVNLHLNGVKYKYESKEPLLDFFEQEGESIDFACRSGVCGACKMKCKSGKVSSLSDSGLTDDEKDEGYILSCVSRPLENSEFEV